MDPTIARPGQEADALSLRPPLPSTVQSATSVSPLTATMPKHDNSESSAASTAEKPEAGFNPGWRFYVAFASISVITLMTALDATSLGNALPKMAELLGGTAIQAFWSGTSYLLTSTVLQPVVGSLSEIFGRKPLVLLSIAFFGAGAIVAALANNFTIILVGRTIQGIGGGGILVLVEIIITDMIPLRLRGNYYSFISSMWALGSVVGPILGGGFAQNVTWRWIFWVNLPFVGIGAILVTLFLKLNFKTSSFMAKLARVDWIGMFLGVSSLTGFLVPVTWGGVQYPWDHWRTLVPLLVCGAGLVAFAVWEIYYAKEPMVRFHVLNNRTAAITQFGNFIQGLTLWCIVYYLPLYYQAVLGYNQIVSGIAAFPETFTVAPAAMIVGFTVAKVGKYRWAVWAGWFLATLGLGLMCIMDTNTSIPAWIFLNLVGGAGLGILFPALTYAVQASATNEDMAYAVTLFAFFRSFGQTIGVAIGGTIFQNQMKLKLESYPLLAPMADEYSKDSSALVEIIKRMPEGLMKSQLRSAYADSIRIVWVVCCALAAVAFVASFWTQELSLDRALETEQGFQHKEKRVDEEEKARSEN